MTDLKVYFKFICILGICLSAVSLFLEWYSFQIFSWEGDLVALWEFNLFSGWETPFPADDWFNNAYEPNFLPVPMIINIIYLFLMVINFFSTLVINFEKQRDLRKIKKFGYIYLSSILIGGYFICIVPIYFFVLSKFYFPYLTFTDPEFVVMEYGIAIGYWLQCLAFVCIFPYALYFAITTTRFEQAPQSYDKTLKDIITKVNVHIDLDQLIAEERVKLEQYTPAQNSKHYEQDIFEQFLNRRGAL